MIVVKVEAAFGGRWYDDPDAMTWTDVTAWSEIVTAPRVSWRRGRAVEMDRTPQPGSFSVLLNGLDGAFIPENAASAFYPNVQPGLPVRLSVAGVVCFTGFVTDLEPDVDTGSFDGSSSNWTEVALSAVDGWARVMQAGKRLTYRDRVLTDLAGGRTLAWILGQDVEVGKSNGSVTPIVAQDRQSFGLWWGRLVSGGLAWSTPGAAQTLVETGGGDNSRQYTYMVSGIETVRNRGGFASDRFGGVWGPVPVAAGYPDRLQQATAWGISNTASAYGLDVNSVRQQVSVGRPPKQLLPVSCLTAAGWTPSGGTVTDESAVSQTWTAKSDAFDPATGVRSVRVDGPDRVIVWSGSAANTDWLRSAPFAVTPGMVLVGHVGTDLAKTGGDTALGVTVEWLDAGGLVIGSGVLALGALAAPDVITSPMLGSSVWTAPVGAVQARMAVRSHGATVRLQAGVYVAPVADATGGDNGSFYLPPGRWWAQGASDHLVLSLQVPLTDPAAIGVTVPSGRRLWLLGETVVDSWADGGLHSVTWNVSPGVDGQPKLWVDGVGAAVAWRLSDPGVVNGWDGGITYVPVIAGATFGQANGSSSRINPVTANPSSPSVVATALGFSGADRWNASPDDTLTRRWHVAYGAPATVEQAAVTGTTDVVLASLLDALAWPDGARDLDTGLVTSSAAWTDGADLGDYSAAVSALAAAEFGWAGVDASGSLVWRRRGWYDPDGDGTTVAKAHLTYKAGEVGKVTYQVGLGQSFSDSKVVNQVVVSGKGTAQTALVEDYESQDRIGARRLELTNTTWDQAAVDAVAQEAAALYRMGLVPDKVRVVVTADDPMLATLLGLNPADVVLVTIPRAPAADLTVSALVGSLDLSTDGITLTVELSLGPCPVAATPPAWTGPVFLGLDAGGPYFDPARAESSLRLSSDASGWFVDPAGTDHVAVDVDGPYVLEGS